MELNDIKEIMELFSNSQIFALDLEKEGIHLKLKKQGTKMVQSVAPLPVEPVVTEKPAAPVEVEDNFIYVTSPIVGTFYAAPNPQADPFVKVGSHISVGQTLCIIEAMKLMNEIQSEVTGEVVKVLVSNAQPVEYGQKIYAIRPV